jgi:hypothetical protein
LPSFLRKQESSVFWIPGRIALARNDDPTPENVKLRESPGRAGGFLDPNYWSDGVMEYWNVGKRIQEAILIMIP